LEESHDFNKYVKTLRVKIAKRVRKTNKSPEDQQKSGRPTRVRKTTKGKNKKHEDPRKPARVRKKIAKSQESRSPRVWRAGTI
jgi:hypothetical protein